VKKIKTLRNILLALASLLFFAALHYALPQVDVVRAVGAQIKRVDVSDGSGGVQRTRDVYFVQMETPNGKPRVYRNEDNLLYGKFDSANLQAQVQSLSDGKQMVALRHYGWRLPLFSEFPNALKAWPVDEGYRHVPVFNTLVLLTLAGLGILGVRRLRHVSFLRADQRRMRDAENAAPESESTRGAAAQHDRGVSAKDRSDIDDFLNADQAGKR